MDILTAAKIVYGPKPCEHAPHRLYSWFAYDNTLCVCCCDCGAVLAGGVK